MGRCAGIDLASEEHRLRVLDADGRNVEEAVVTHDERGIEGLLRTLAGLSVERVALERPDGILVERLLAAGICVLAIHPNQVKAARPRFQVAAGKSDGFDAFLLAELARTDHHRFRALVPDSDETKALRALTRAREDLVAARVRLANQLRAELERFWPGAAGVFADIDSPIALAFLERYPSPGDARRLGPSRLGQFLARHGYSGRRTPQELLGRLREAPSGRAGETETEARRAVVLALVACLRPIVEKIRELTSEIAGALEAHPDGAVFRSLFADPKAVVCAATLLAEIGDCRARYPSSAALAADAGMAAVAVELTWLGWRASTHSPASSRRSTSRPSGRSTATRSTERSTSVVHSRSIPLSSWASVPSKSTSPRSSATSTACSSLAQSTPAQAPIGRFPSFVVAFGTDREVPLRVLIDGRSGARRPVAASVTSHRRVGLVSQWPLQRLARMALSRRWSVFRKVDQ